MPNELDDFLKDVKGDTQDPFIQAVTPETKSEDEEVKEEKPIPFHKDPKVQRFIEKEVQKKLQDFKPSEADRFSADTKDSSDEITDVLTRIIGNDTPDKLSAIKDFKKVLIDREERGAQRALEQLNIQAQEEREAEVEAEQELAQGFENVEEQFGVDLTSNTAQARKERSEFVDFIRRVAPKNEDGDVTQFPDLTETYYLYKETKKSPTASRAKELSSRSMSRSSEATAPTQSTDRSWNAVDKIFSKFSN